MIENSFYLLRTNPALTGNVKIVVGSDYKLYLESFNVDKTLKQNKFKHFKFKKEDYYKEQVSLFFEDAENSSIFGVKNIDDKSLVHSDYSYQFDDTYFSGAFFTQDTFYEEEYEYFAPLYVKKGKLPKSFIILRIDGPGTINGSSSPATFRSDFIDKWKVVKMFDLTENSDFGFWLDRNITSDESFPNIPMELSYNEIESSTINGLDVNFSGWTTNHLNIISEISENTPIFKTEEYFTKIWENNSLLYPHIFNFKFLFDDTPATPTDLKKYSLNRYVGFYLDDTETLKTISPYQGFELNKIPDRDLRNLSASEISEVPYILNNTFVREIDERLYSFDPIKNGWTEGQTYWIEFEDNFYQLERVANTETNLFRRGSIIGDYLYRVISSVPIEFEVSDDEVDEVKKQKSKVLINDLNRNKEQIQIVPELRFNNITATNIIRNVNEDLVSLKRVYDYFLVDNVRKYLFRIDIEGDIDNNTNVFNIDNYDEADLYLILIQDEYYVLKKYDDDIPNVGGFFYLQTDYSFDVSDNVIRKWINNGNITRDARYFSETNILNVPVNEQPTSFEILRAKFTDVKDFDFERVDTKYSEYEYEKEFQLTPSLEPKLYAKEYRDIIVEAKVIEGDVAKRIPIKDINNRPLTIREQNNDINPFTQQPYKADEIFFQNFEGDWDLFEGNYQGTNFTAYDVENLTLKRDFYREEDYIWRLEDTESNQSYEINFKENSFPKQIKEELTFGVDGNNEFSNIKGQLPSLNDTTDPNEKLDLNYIPVSSEYIATDELWELRDNELTAIWDKNQSICKWGYQNSNDFNDYPYRLNFSLDVGDVFNRTSNVFSGLDYPSRPYRDLDYFYRFGLENADDYTNHNLHLKQDFFDIDAYIKGDYDYFEYLFKSDQQISDGIRLTKKYSMINADEVSDSATIFKGIRYKIFDVNEVLINQEEFDETGIVSIEDITNTPNEKYDGYKFSIIFSRKLSTFETNPGSNNSNMGIDVYLNDKYKNILVHVFINTDEIIEIGDINNNNTFNLETTTIDNLYQDNLDNRDVNPTQWDKLDFKISNFSIGLRPRDLRLNEFLFILNEFNFSPEENNENKDELQFIHIYEDGRFEKYDWLNTDFMLDYDSPTEIVTKRDAYITEEVPDENIPDFFVNNTIRNRIALDDDLISSTEFTQDGIKVDSINDFNFYNDYPIAKTIRENLADNREYWELNSNEEPSIWRYSGAYTPIFKDIELFRPMGYLELTNNNRKPILKSGNYKFYDPFSSSNDNPVLRNFGNVRELLFSKCNPDENVLKIQDETDTEKSVYPMVDEYGYDFDERYIFSSTWENNYHYLTREIEIDINEYSQLSGRALVFNGFTSFLRIEDKPKFNLETYLINELNYTNNINIEPKITNSFNFLNVTNQVSYDFDVIPNLDYTVSFEVNQSGGQFTYNILLVKSNGSTSSLVTNTTSNTSVNESISLPFNGTRVQKEDINGVYATIRVQVSNTVSSNIFISVNQISNEARANKLLIDMNLPDSSNGFSIDESETSTWGLFIKKEDEKVDILKSPVKILDWNTVSGIAPVPNFNSRFNKINGVDVFFFQVSGQSTIWEIRDGYRTAVPNITVLNEKRIKYYGSAVPVQTITQADLDSVPVSAYHGLIRDLNVELSSKGYSAYFDYYNENNTAVIKLDNNRHFDIDVEYYTYLNDRGSLVYIGDSEGDATIKPSRKFTYFRRLRENSISFRLEFENFEDIIIKAQVKASNSSQIFTDQDILGSINNQLLDTQYEAVIDSTQVGNSNNGQFVNKVTFEIRPVSTNSGSYFNFEIKDLSVDLRLEDDFVEAESMTTTNLTLNKTSLKDDSERLTGFLNEFTVEFYVKLLEFGKPNETIIYKGLDTDIDSWSEDFKDFTYILGRDESTDKIAFRTSHKDYDGTLRTHTLLSDVEINDDDWHHVAFKVNLLERSKSLLFDSKLDITVVDYLEETPEISEREQVARFLENRQRFLPGIVYSNASFNDIGDEQQLADDIRNNVNTPGVEYWYNVILGFTNASVEDIEFMRTNWLITINEAYRQFEENRETYKYYLNTDTDLQWDTLIGTDSTVSLGRRNFSGLIDELRIWNYSRTDEEIQKNYRFVLRPDSYLNPLKSLVSYYRFTESTSTLTQFNDLMDGNMIKDIDFWSKITERTEDNGKNITESTNTNFLIFETDFYEGVPILAETEELDYDYSGADLVGTSDERNVLDTPPAQFGEDGVERETPIVKRDKYTRKKIQIKKKTPTPPRIKKSEDIKSPKIRIKPVRNVKNVKYLWWLRRKELRLKVREPYIKTSRFRRFKRRTNRINVRFTRVRDYEIPVRRKMLLSLKNSYNRRIVQTRKKTISIPRRVKTIIPKFKVKPLPTKIGKWTVKLKTVTTRKKKTVTWTNRFKSNQEQRSFTSSSVNKTLKIRNIRGTR